MKKIIIFLMTVISINIYAQENDQQNNKQVNPLSLQPITVTIGGNFIVTGSFASSRFQRLDHFITTLFIQAEQKALGTINKPEIIKQIKKEIEKYPLRDITLRHSDGEIKKIDLLKFRLTGDFKHNPYLKQDDVIIFPSYDLERDIIDISGAVNKSTQIQFVDGDKLSDAIMFAGGINRAYENITEADISRLSSNGKLEKIVTVKLNSDIQLERGDRIMVIDNENNKKAYKCLVLGEVNRPGYVYISKDNTTLKELIKKVGGFTSNADLNRAEIMRGTDEVQLQKMKSMRDQYEKDSTFTTLQVFAKTIEELLTEELKMTRSHNLTKEEYEGSFVFDNYLRFIEKKNVIDFTKVLSDSSEENKTYIHDGDMIIIPAIQNLVYVFGQVINPGFVSYDFTKEWTYYIQKAGGYTQEAKGEDDVQIIKGKNRAWVNAKEVKTIESGDLLYIPKSIKKDFSYYLQQIGSMTSIVSTAISIIIIIILATK